MTNHSIKRLTHRYTNIFFTTNSIELNGSHLEHRIATSYWAELQLQNINFNKAVRIENFTDSTSYLHTLQGHCSQYDAIRYDSVYLTCSKKLLNFSRLILEITRFKSNNLIISLFNNIFVQ